MTTGAAFRGLRWGGDGMTLSSTSVCGTFAAGVAAPPDLRRQARSSEFA